MNSCENGCQRSLTSCWQIKRSQRGARSPGPVVRVRINEGATYAHNDVEHIPTCFSGELQQKKTGR
ncbi:hypothetical protein M378DRAFT_163632 [Amanita muscaria Koide BX008]|uniref:Uncharacterized protein n=1 Tax=Amanita muscaria (strain Koide BX008) TaxID=946122 RepID=A0A0C2SLU1_AMAMK|nr:hypothetical protein M378DRAFT_163632 [Amanita muscaria Koide BX008]